MLAKTNQTGPQTSLLWLLNLLGYLGSGRSPGGGHGNSLQYSCLGNLMDRSNLACTICNPILGVVGVGWFSAVSSQLSTLLVAEGASGQHITASTTSPCFSHEKICKSPKKDKNIVSIFCTFKMLIDMAKFLFRNLEPIYTSISNEQRGPFPNLLVSLEYLIFENCLCCGGRMHFIILIFISFIIREVDHLFECFSGPLLFFTHWFVETLFILWIVNVSLSYFPPQAKLVFQLYLQCILL